MAFHDALTGLPNRHWLNTYVQKSLAEYKMSNKNLAVMYLDIDRFKFINDTKGHDNGDILLKEVAERLKMGVKHGDLVARYGGDEFILLMKDINKSKIIEAAEQLLELFKNPFILDNEKLFISPSIGISMYPQDGTNQENLIKNADRAMLSAKNLGKNNFQFYNYEDERYFERQTIIEQGLRNALKNNEFFLHYQPIVEFQTGKIIATEALVRWKHPVLGLVRPLEFIPATEQAGLIIPLGKWVLNEACKQNKLWQADGIRIKMSVNVSPLQFKDNCFVETIKEALSENQLSSEYLGLEITESVMQDINHSSDIIHELKKIGVNISIDDFGTGYSSLSVLNNLPIDILKIDKSFVDEITTKASAASLIKMIIKMGEVFNFDLVAEGIENEQQAEFLRKSGCRYGQGYLYSRPLPAEEVASFFETVKN
jgi:diguanylate cyclase (GGDEF)-like protein